MKTLYMTRRQVITAAVCAAILVAPWGTASAASKLQIMFNNFSGRGTMANFPALIKLNAGIGGFSYSGFRTSTGNDLRFWGNSDLTQELNYEIESWNTGGTSCVWVQVPIFTHNCSVWATWGDYNYTNQQAYTTNGATWSQGYKGVWHMNAAGTQCQDSTSGKYQGAINGTTTTTGDIANGQDFNGSSSYITLPAGAFSAISNQVTVSAWQYGRSAGNVSFFEGQASGSRQLLVYLPWGSYIIFESFGNQLVTTNGVGQLVGQWNHFVFVRDAGTISVYMNGNELATGAGSGTYVPITTFYLGSGVGGGSYYNGVIDEFRVSNTARSANWIWASWMNQGANHNSFVNYGAVQEQAVRGIMFFVK